MSWWNDMIERGWTFIDPSGGVHRKRPVGTFECPNCYEENLPDEVGTVTCDSCGAVIETSAS